MSSSLPLPIDPPKQYCQTLCLDSGIDYRRRNRPSAGKLYFLSSETDAEAKLDKLFDELAFKQNDITRPRVLNVHGRKVRLNKACGTIADCTFEELCDRPLGASDYLEISRLFDTVFIRHIPLLTLNKKTQARRLITMIDALYDHKVRVVILADHPLDDIFVHDGDHDHDESHILMDDLGLKRVRARRGPAGATSPCTGGAAFRCLTLSMPFWVGPHYTVFLPRKCEDDP